MSYNSPLSFWEKDAWLSQLDVVIIGGGIVGMNAAIHIAQTQPKLKIAIIEQSSLGTGASTRNAGFACYGSPSEIVADLNSMSSTEVFHLVERRVKGLNLLRSIVGDQHMNYLQHGGYEVFLDREELTRHLDLLNDINTELALIDPQLQFYRSDNNRGLRNVAGIIANDWEGQLHPGLMTKRLRQLCASKGIRLLSNLKVERIEETTPLKLCCGQIDLKARRVIICTNGYAHDLLTVKAPAPGRNQVLLTTEITNLQLRGCYHYDQGYVYFRNVGQRVLIGGGRNIAMDEETTDQFGLNPEIRAYLLAILNRHILSEDEYEIEDSWSGILGFNETKNPLIKELSPNLFAAVGLGGMGVAIGSLLGQEVAALLLQS